MECCGWSLVGGALVDGVLWVESGGWGTSRRSVVGGVWWVGH